MAGFRFDLEPASGLRSQLLSTCLKTIPDPMTTCWSSSHDLQGKSD